MKGKYLLLGSNQGDRKMNLIRAGELIESEVGKIQKRSSFYETEAWGYHDQPAFYNQVLEISTSCSPEVLLEKVKHIESEMGRKIRKKWRERIIDIDILYFDDMIINSASLVIPHPEIPNRKFTLIPLCEISGNQIHPQSGKTQARLLLETTDHLSVRKI